MQNLQIPLSPAQKIRAANAQFLEYYAQFASHMLTLTFKVQENDCTPAIVQIDSLLNHIRATLNWSIWKKRTKYNAKAKILYIPIVEGLNDDKRVHVHVLLGNIKSEAHVRAHIEAYISGSSVLGFRYDIQSVYAHDGISWYLTKETYGANTDAVRWNAALIPAALVPKGHTLLKA